MAKRFLTHLDLAGNQILKAAFEKLTTDPITGNFEGRLYYNTNDGLLKVYHNSAWHFVGAITDVQGTTNEVTVSVDGDGVATIGLPDTIYADVVGDLTGNADTATKLATARTISLAGDASGSVTFDGSADAEIEVTITSTSSVHSLSGTTGQVNVSASVGDVTISLPDTVDVDISGNAATATNADYANTAGVANSVAADSVTLGTDTVGDYVAGVSASTGIDVSGTGEGASVVITNTDKGSDQNIYKLIWADDENTIAPESNSAAFGIHGGDGIYTYVSGPSDIYINNTGVLSVSGTTNEIEVSASTGSVTIGLPDDVTVGQDLTVTRNATVNGDFTVKGTTTYINTQDLNVKDNIVTLNYGLAASVAPTLDAGIEIARGASATVGLHWNETTDVWQATTDGSTYKNVLLSGDASSADISDFTEAAQDAVGAMLADTATIDFTYTDATPELKADVKLKASDSYLTSASGLAVDIAAVETKLVSDSFTKKASANVGNGVNTSFAVSHGLGTRDVVVNVYDNSTYDTVEVDVVRTDTDTVTVSFATAPGANAYRVVVVG